jgi:AraC family transcriptional regulator
VRDDRPCPVKAVPLDLFTVRETHGILLRPESRVRASSDALGWTSLYASAAREAPYHDSFGAVRDHLTILHLSGPVRVNRTLGGTREGRVIPPGGMFMVPGGIDFSVGLDGALDTLHVYLRRSVIEEVAGDLVRGDPAHVELVPRLGHTDPLIRHLVLGIRDALGEADPTTATYADYLARAMAARLLRGHSNATRPAPPQPNADGLNRRQLARAVDFIEAKLGGSLSLQEIASASGLSPVHFARQFKRTTGTTPHQYVMRVRIERAKRLLAQTDLAIAQIAYECGFSHQEHLTRIFRRLSGTTPSLFRHSASL